MYSETIYSRWTLKCFEIISVHEEKESLANNNEQADYQICIRPKMSALQTYIIEIEKCKMSKKQQIQY